MPNISMVKCPGCGSRLKIDGAEQGMKLGCPACRVPFTLGNRAAAGAAQDFVAFELFDPDVALDDVPVTVADVPAAAKVAPVARAARPAAPAAPVAKAAPLLKRGDVEHPIGDAGVKKPPAKRPRRDDIADNDDYDDEEMEILLGGRDWGEPRYRKAWNTIYWGLTLVLFSVLLYGGGMVMAFIAVFMVAGSDGGLEALGILGIAFMLLVAADFVRLPGYGMCLMVPGKTSARSYVWIAIGMAVASTLCGVFRVIVSFMDPFLAAHIVGAVGTAVGFLGLISYMMFMETIADMNKERGIADSVAGLIKLAGTLGLTVGIGLAIQVGVAYWVSTGKAPRWLDPASGDTTIYIIAAIGSCYMAFVGILGLVVFVKFLLAILNVRRVIEQNI